MCNVYALSSSLFKLLSLPYTIPVKTLCVWPLTFQVTQVIKKILVDENALVLCVAPHIAAGGMGARTGAGVGGGNQYPVSSALDLLAETESWNFKAAVWLLVRLLLYDVI